MRRLPHALPALQVFIPLEDLVLFAPAAQQVCSTLLPTEMCRGNLTALIHLHASSPHARIMAQTATTTYSKHCSCQQETQRPRHSAL